MSENSDVRIFLACQPLTLNRKEAIAYTGLPEKTFSMLEKDGSIRGRRYGKNGSLIYRRIDLEYMVARLFDAELGEFGVCFDGPIEFD
ncbi:hypothetical protein JQK15_03875 [Sphingobium sp. BHU LFT2]|uniref:hypothetical protein n=1 Tax=Sphingobium sp. BHU LFT2 TaxID=2807634 RepID=UPI001BE91E72|nr:hypothetical protein [Sphingobium sp. BHU LFT2]MBT2242667.1 hypothetical protein [Sphingobium sp. BHU LFT2]